jgi:hypothetical protein
MALAAVLAIGFVLGSTTSAAAASFAFNPADLDIWYAKNWITKAVTDYKNTDIKAYLRVPNTDIVYPVVIAPAGQDNNYYNYRNYYGNLYNGHDAVARRAGSSGPIPR